MEGFTVNKLKNACEEIIEKGYGDKTILISCDDEGNGFHTLYYGFLTEHDDVTVFAELFHDYNDPCDVVLLG